MPTEKWSNKDERQYQHIKSDARRRGVSDKRAKAIAGATVNKTRRRKGRTPNKTTQGTGNPNTRLEDRSKRELYNIARDRDISRRSTMSKPELVKAIRARG